MPAQAPPVVAASAELVKLGYLDALRGLAILAVLEVHCASMAGVGKGNPRLFLTMQGQRGVNLFFMVSAFTLFYSMARRREEQHPLANFYLRRFFRIAPLFYLADLAALACFGLHMRPVLWLSGILFLNSWSHTGIGGMTPGSWSIAVESMFYLMLPWLFARIRSLGAAVWAFLLASAVVVPLSYYLSWRLHSMEYFTFFWFPVELPIFLLGIVAYFLVERYDAAVAELPAERTPAARRGLSATLLVMGALVFLLSLEPSASVADSWHVSHYTALYPLMIAFVLLIVALRIEPWPLLVNRFTRFVGKVSYSLYLGHAFVLFTLEKVVAHVPAIAAALRSRALAGTWLGTAAWLLVVLTLGLPLSVLLWKFVEQPGIRLGRRLIAHREHRAAAHARTLVGPFSELTSPANTPDAQF